jgi:hypothetical protein
MPVERGWGQPEPEVCEVHIYPTVCVWWEVNTNHVYTLWESADLKTWSPREYFTEYTPPYNMTNMMWRPEHEQVKFFKVEVDGVVGEIFPSTNPPPSNPAVTTAPPTP